MQVLVLYHTRTGNTEKLAEHVAAGVQQVEGVTCVLKSTTEVTQDDFLASDGIIAGSPVYFGVMAAELKEVFDRFVHVRSQMGGKVGAAFSTSGDLHGGGETTLLSILHVLLIFGMVIVGDPLAATGHYGVTCTGTPDERSAGHARQLGERVASLVRQVRG